MKTSFAILLAQIVLNFTLVLTLEYSTLNIQEYSVRKK